MADSKKVNAGASVLFGALAGAEKAADEAASKSGEDWMENTGAQLTVGELHKPEVMKKVVG